MWYYLLQMHRKESRRMTWVFFPHVPYCGEKKLRARKKILAKKQNKKTCECS